MEPTHILDGQPLIQRRDGMGRTYYTDMRNKRVPTAGRSLEIIEEDTRQVLLQELADPDKVSEIDLTEVPFLGVGVAISAILAGHGYHELGGYCAHRCGDRAATLSVPQTGGGHKKYRVEFPEVLHLALEEVE